MAEYRARPGQEDRDGEMTGAITFNMALSMPPVAIWAIFIGPWLVANVWLRLAVALAMAIVLPLSFMPLSRRIWAWFSHWGDTRLRIVHDDADPPDV